MAEITRGDTWPALRGKAMDSQGLLDLTAANSVKILLKNGGETVSGEVTPIDPPETDPAEPTGPGFNWEYVWAAEDTKTAGKYEVELEITWDDESEPKKVQSIPSGANPTLEILPDLG